METTKQYPQKRFLAAWGSSYVKPGTQEVGLEFFSDELGYGDAAREEVDALGVGETCHLDAGDHTVTRLS